MTGVTTGQTSFATATDSDDVEAYSTGALVTVLQAIANLFESTTGHDHTGAGKGKPVAAAGIANGAVGTVALAANAVTQNAQSQIATGSTTSLTAVDTGLTVTLTTTGGDVLLIATLVSSNSGANTLFLNFARDGTNIGNVGKVTASGAGATRTTTVVLRDPAPSAASHIYRLQYSVSAGTETIDTGINSTLDAIELKR